MALTKQSVKLDVTSVHYFVYLGDYYRVSNTVRLLQFKLILAKLDGFMLSSFSIPSTYEAEVTIVLFLINNYLDVLPQ